MNFFKCFSRNLKKEQQEKDNTRIAMQTMFASGVNSANFAAKRPTPGLNNAQKFATLQMMRDFNDD